MSDLKLARVLLTAAERDITALRGMADAKVFANEIFGFPVRQATEKLLKANLSLPEEPYPATHDLMRRLEWLKAHQPEAGDRFDDLTAYNPYAVQRRYSAGDPGLSPPDRNAAYSFWKCLWHGVGRTWQKIAHVKSLAVEMPTQPDTFAKPQSDRPCPA
ncbi:MAG: HEPN domain-containing protein [Gammaproteobacteria bacterium]|nr:HEPN domain-containing protein [Gammaproteobacteria bacterium]